MVVALLVGVIVGFILALPPGPVAMASIKMGLERSNKEAIQMATGTALMDVVFCLIAVLAASAIESAAGEYFNHNPLMLLFFQIVVVAALIYFGIVNLKKKSNESNYDNEDKKIPEYLKNLRSKGPFLLGIAFSIANIANPTFLPSLAVMSAWVHKFNFFQNTVVDNISFATGFGFGNFIWLYTLAYIVMRHKHKLSDESIMRIKQFAGLTFIGFGGFIGFRVLMFTNWPTILKIAFAF